MNEMLVPFYLILVTIVSEPNNTFTLFASHSVCKSSEDFENWTKFDPFRLAHKNAMLEEATKYLDKAAIKKI